MCFQFLERSLGDAEELNEFSPILTAIAFGDVGGDGNSRPANLRGHPIQFLFGKCLREAVAGLSQRHPFLPNSQISVGLDRILRNLISHSLLTTHYSPSRRDERAAYHHENPEFLGVFGRGLSDSVEVSAFHKATW